MGPELRTGSRSVPQYGTRIRDWVPLSLRLLLEMGGVCYEPGRPNRGVRCDGPGLVIYPTLVGRRR